ncbi:hypothetical protein C8J57DRAFT_1537038 [Mycena rebaudengoi]|nr:hypothetical protein C8J57DRAFT_1537038 [Mycena rebaudengoi]
MRASKDGSLRQRFAFFGGCTPAHPRYTLLTIVLNRSVARPLVRGESMFIILIRAVILKFCGVGVPAFAIYSIIIVPSTTEIYTRAVVLKDSVDKQIYGSGPATIFLVPFDPIDFNNYGVKVSANGNTHCPVAPSVASKLYLEGSEVIVCQCEPESLGWKSISELSISIFTPDEMLGVYVHLRQGSDFEMADQIYSPLPGSPFNLHPPIFLLPRSNLVGVLTWTERRVMNSVSWALPTSWKSVFIPELFHPNSSRYGGRLGLLRHRHIRWFWTFVNGAFALVFGANVVYFAFGRRPLSALGVAHIFQQYALARKWHEDFPAIHSEGGLPGTESAGIVAFIRERLIDLGDDLDGHDKNPGSHLESNSSHGRASPAILEMGGGHRAAELASRSPQTAYLLDAGYTVDAAHIPLMDINKRESAAHLMWCANVRDVDGGGDADSRDTMLWHDVYVWGEEKQRDGKERRKVEVAQGMMCDTKGTRTWTSDATASGGILVHSIVYSCQKDSCHLPELRFTLN